LSCIPQILFTHPKRRFEYFQIGDGRKLTAPQHHAGEYGACGANSSRLVNNWFRILECAGLLCWPDGNELLRVPGIAEIGAPADQVNEHVRSDELRWLSPPTCYWENTWRRFSALEHQAEKRVMVKSRFERNPCF